MNNSVNTSSEPYDHTAESIRRFTQSLTMYFPPFMILVGSICNIFVIMVMRTMQFRYISTSFYMCANAVIDTFSLIVLLTVDWLHVNFPWTIYRGQYAHYMCKSFAFFGTTSSDLGVVLTAAMTLERSSAVTFPLKSTSWCTVRRARHVTIFLIVFTSVKNLNYLFTSDIDVAHNADRLCYVYVDTEALEHFWSHVWPWIHNGFLLLSFLTIIISNIIIIRHIKRSDRMRNKAAVSNTSSEGSGTYKVLQKSQSRRRQIAMMLLIDSFTVIVCTTPFSIYTTIDSNTNFLSDTEYHRQIKRLISSISFYLLYVNRCANFYLYCMSGSRFRKSLKNVCICYKNDESLEKKMRIYCSKMHENSDICSQRHSTLKSNTAVM